MQCSDSFLIQPRGCVTSPARLTKPRFQLNIRKLLACQEGTSLEESLALCDVRFSIQKNEFDPWLRGLADSDIQRFVRARGTNVYGHDWRFQGADAAGAVAYGALRMLIAHAEWRNASGIDDLKFQHPLGFPSLLSHAGWEQDEKGSIMRLRLGGLDSSLLQAFLSHFALLCESGQTQFGLGNRNFARIVVDLSEWDSTSKGQSLVSAIGWHIVREIALPNLLFMLVQSLNPVQLAMHPKQVLNLSFPEIMGFQLINVHMAEISATSIPRFFRRVGGCECREVGCSTLGEDHFDLRDPLDRDDSTCLPPGEEESG